MSERHALDVVDRLVALVPEAVPALEYPGYVTLALPGRGVTLWCGDGGEEHGWDVQIMTDEGDVLDVVDGPARDADAEAVAQRLAAIYRERAA